MAPSEQPVQQASPVKLQRESYPFLFLLSSQLSRRTRAETLAAQATLRELICTFLFKGNFRECTCIILEKVTQNLGEIIVMLFLQKSMSTIWQDQKMVYNTVATLVYKLFIFFCEHKLLKNMTIIIKEYYVVRYVKVTVHHPLPADLFADRQCILLFKVMKSCDK